MPMKTTSGTAGTPLARRGSVRLAWQTWPMISAVVRLRLKPWAPVAQNAQSRAQPTCEEMHSVPRAGSGMNTASTAWPAAAENSHLTVPSAERLSAITGGSHRSVIGSNRSTPRRCIQASNWRARKRFSPMSAKNASRPLSVSPRRFVVLPSLCISSGRSGPGDETGPRRPGRLPGDLPRRTTLRRADFRSARSRADAAVGEKECDLARGGFGRVRSVHDVLLDAGREVRADRPLGRLRRVRRAHDLAVPAHRVLAFQHEDHDRAGRHVAHEVVVKRPLPVHGIELAGFLF